MPFTRRALLVASGGVLTAGCLSGDQNGDGGSSTPSPGSEDCDPDAVTRPPVVEDTDHPPQGYGTKPMELTAQSVPGYLSDFETAYAWNRILDEQESVNSLNINTVDGYTPEETDGGFLASSRIETSYTVGEEHELHERGYVTNYYVSEALVYRVETESEPTDPRTHDDSQLVQCGPE